MTAPVLLAFYSRTRMPESGQLADDLVTVVEEHEGRYLLGLVDVDAVPQIAQAMQIPSIPLVVAVVDGRPMPLLQDVLPIEELRTALTQVGQQLTAQGIAGRHQPRSSAAPAAEGEEETVDPRYAPAQDALVAGDIDGAVAEYQKLLDANPADAEAAGGLAMAKVMQRTQGVDLAAARAAAAEQPRRRRRADDGRRPRHARRARRGRVHPAGEPGGPYGRRRPRRRRATTCSGSSPPSATTTRGCWRDVATWRRPSSDQCVPDSRFSRTERPASSRATGTRNGEHET